MIAKSHTFFCGLIFSRKLVYVFSLNVALRCIFTIYIFSQHLKIFRISLHHLVNNLNRNMLVNTSKSKGFFCCCFLFKFFKLQVMTYVSMSQNQFNGDNRHSCLYEVDCNISEHIGMQRSP